MKKTLSTLFLLAPLLVLAQWNDPRIGSVGKEHPRTQFNSYERRDDAVTYNPDKSDYYLSLNGDWGFMLSNSGEKFDTAFLNGERGNYDVSPIPGFYGVVSVESLKNITPPQLPQDNKVGLYRQFAAIPVGWLDRDIFIKIKGIRTGVGLYVNGNYVGYAEDGAVPAEFNISKFVSDGTNVIVLAVYEWTTGSWLENNALGGVGIAAGVSLYSQPRVHIEDFFIRTTIDSTFTKGIAALDIVLVNNNNYENAAEAWFDLMDHTGKVVRYNYREAVIPGMGGRDTVSFTFEIPNAKFWSASDPYLYSLMFRVKHNGRFTEYIPYKIGIKKVEGSSEGFTINGRSEEIKTVEYTTIELDPDVIRADMKLLKSQGVNSIMCTYHPDKNLLYRICGEEGIYVFEYADIDSSITGDNKAEGGSLGNNPQWLNSYMGRTEDSYFTNRNHTSVIYFGIPENAGKGFNVYRINKKLKDLTQDFYIN
ncbi:MAG: hypothetical protein LIO79_10415 [Rikenellaceae bacterium]|nr:hypothetical protein [Rikenellaceae bacterium]